MKLVFETDVQSRRADYADADLVIASDGLNSRVRDEYADDLQARRRHAAQPLRLARHARAVRRLHVRVRRRRRTAGSRRTPTSSTTTPRPSSSRRPRRSGRSAGLDRMEKEEAIALLREALRRRRSTATRCCPTRRTCAARRSGSGSRASSASAGCTGSTATAGDAGRADGRRRAHRALLDRLRHQARARGRDRARAQSIGSTPATWPARSRHYEEVRSVEVLKIQNAARNSTEWFENVDRYVEPAARAVRVFAADAQPAHQPREPAPARRRLRRGLRGLDRRARGRAARSADAQLDPADADAVPRARRDAEEPRSSSRRWRSTRASTASPATTTSCTSARARWAAPAWSSPR